MARARVVLNSAGMQALLHGDGVARMLHARMERVKDAAVAAVDDSGDYERSLRVVDDHSPTRARSRVVAGVSYALAREAKDRTLGRALDAASG